MKLQIIYRAYVRCQIIGLDPEDKDKAYNHFSVFVPTARFTPKYKIGVWDGYNRYFTLISAFFNYIIKCLQFQRNSARFL